MITNLKILYQYRELLWMWTLRDIKARYKQSYLGIGWAILQPLSMTLVFAIVFTQFVRVPTEGIPYPIFAYTAVLPWTFFATSLSSAIPSLLTNMSLVTKIYFPREILPFAAVGARAVDFLCGVTVFLGLMAFYQVGLNPALLFVPLILLIQIILTLGVTLFASALNVALRDVGQVLPLAIQLWMYATPIVYPVALVPERFRTVYMLNPMAGIIDAYRQVILVGQWPDFVHLGLAALVSLLVFAGAYRYFKTAELQFADII